MVTIVMPFFNRSKLVCGTILNIIRQTYTDWEMIVVDDGSEDAEYKAVKAVCENDSRIIIEKRPETRRKGAQSCRNIGLELARGKYIVFFDSDDFIPEFCLRQRVGFMDEHPELDFAVFPYAEYVSDPSKPTTIGGFRFYSDDLKAFVSRRLPFMVWSNIYKTESLRSHNIRWDVNLKSLQDAFFNITVLCAGLKYDYAENCMIDYYNKTEDKGASISKGIYSTDHFESHIYYLDHVRKMVADREGMKRPLRDGCLYIYSLMMSNCSKEYSTDLISCLKRDLWFYNCATVKDGFYRIVLKRLHVRANVSRWLLFPRFSIARKIILRRQRKFCASRCY